MCTSSKKKKTKCSCHYVWTTIKMVRCKDSSAPMCATLRKKKTVSKFPRNFLIKKTRDVLQGSAEQNLRRFKNYNVSWLKQSVPQLKPAETPCQVSSIEEKKICEIVGEQAFVSVLRLFQSVSIWPGLDDRKFCGP